jgi:hypothetical protein
MGYLSEAGKYSKKDNPYYLNLTQHDATKDQLSAGVVDLNDDKKEKLRKLLTFESKPDGSTIFMRSVEIVKIAKNHDFPSPTRNVMIGGAPWLMSDLENCLAVAGFDIYYAFTKRVVEEENGVKKSTFKHEGFIYKVVNVGYE